MKNTVSTLIVAFLAFITFDVASATTTQKTQTLSLTTGSCHYPVATKTGKTILVTITGGQTGTNAANFYDCKNQLQKIVYLSGRPADFRYVVSPDNNELYVTMLQPLGNTTIYAINTETYAIKEFAIGSTAGPMAYDTDKKEMNVMVNEGNGWHNLSISVDDVITSDTFVSTLTPTGMAYDPHNRSVDIVSNAKDIYVMDTATRAITTLTVSALTAGSISDDTIVVNPNNNYVYVLSAYNVVNVLSCNTIIATIGVSVTHISNTQNLGFNPASGEVYVSLYDEGGYVFFIKDLALSGPPLQVNGWARFFAYNVSDGNIYCDDYLGGAVYVIDANHELVNTLSISPSGQAYGMVSNPVNKAIHIAALGPAPGYGGRDVAFKGLGK